MEAFIFEAKMLAVAQSLNESHLNEVTKKSSKVRRNALRIAIHNQESPEILKRDHELLPNYSFFKQCFENWK